MWKAPTPIDEDERLDDLRKLDTLLTTPEAPLDHVTHELARIFDVPGAFISFIDKDTQYFKSEVGLPERFAATRTEPREISLCSYVVGTNEELIVEDLSADERFRDNMAVSQFGVRFYAGAPLRGEGGHAIGSLCIVDLKPRSVTPREQQLLSVLAEGVMAQVRLQVASRQLLDRTMKTERDLRQAMRVQRFLLPEPVVERGGWRVEHVYRPVDHLGGDFLDVQPCGDGGLAVLIADVSGHGTTAALTATMTKTAFMRAIAGCASPAEVLTEMNRELMQFAPPGQFITAQVVRLACDSGSAVVASAGHPYPLRATAGGVEVIKTDNGTPLLIDMAMQYRDTALNDLGAHESLLLYTDGAFEALNADKKQLGVDGLRSLVKSTWRGGAALDAVVRAVVEHAGGSVADDVALVSISR